jgi:hypothetical protein
MLLDGGARHKLFLSSFLLAQKELTLAHSVRSELFTPDSERNEKSPTFAQRERSEVTISDSELACFPTFTQSVVFKNMLQTLAR